MPSGFFQGGFAEGALDRSKQMLAEQTQEQDVGLRTRGLDIQERALQRNQAQDDVKRFDGLISDTMTQAGAVIKEGLAAGRDPATILKSVQPIVDSAKPLAAKVGRDPATLDAQVRAMLTSPTGVETATAAGTASAAKTVAEAKGLEAAGFEGGVIKDPVKKIEAEGKLRDDYVRASKDFTTLRDFKDRIDNAPATGAGDIALVFSYMKVLDPTSTVREGEFATASNAAGVPDAVRGMMNQIIGGGKLAVGAREQIKQTADGIWKKASERQNTLTNQYAGAAKRYGLNPKNIIIDPLEAGSKPDPLGIR